MADKNDLVLELDNVSIGYRTESGYVPAVRGVSLAIEKRQSFGLVGESGSGKSTLALGAIRYLAANGRLESGRINFLGEDISNHSIKQMQKLWGSKIGMVYQNPSTALNPSIRIGWQLAEAAEQHQNLLPKEAYKRAVETMAVVSMPEPEHVARLYPHQLSGGMLQRCIIAMALMNQPDLLVMDEPTTALDVTTQAVVLDLASRLKTEFGSAIFYITHDLAVVAQICDMIGVMYAGELLESGPAREIFKNPHHPYTQSLLGSIPQFEEKHRKQGLVSLPGFIPRLWDLPPGCIFAPRCQMARPNCLENHPAPTATTSGRYSVCPHWDQIGPLADTLDQQPVYSAPANEDTFIQVKGITKTYKPLGSGLSIGKKEKLIKALSGVTLSAPQGVTLGIVGESGCGKTTLLRSIIGLVEPTGGEVILDKTSLPSKVSKRPKSLLKKIQMVFQNPDASLNPNQTIAQALARPLKIFGSLSQEEIQAKVLELLTLVKLPPNYYHRLPGELSGGELQRVGIARAFAAEPDVILLDEPLSALDVSVQASLVNLLFELQVTKQPTYLFISHDLAAVHHISDWVAVMYLGRVVEFGSSADVFKPPFHPYTEALLSAIPVPDPDAEQNGIRLEGSVPSPTTTIVGCAFASRCPRVSGPCRQTPPPSRKYRKTGTLFCHLEPEYLTTVQKSFYHGQGMPCPQKESPIC